MLNWYFGRFRISLPLGAKAESSEVLDNAPSVAGVNLVGQLGEYPLSGGANTDRDVAI